MNYKIKSKLLLTSIVLFISVLIYSQPGPLDDFDEYIPCNGVYSIGGIEYGNPVIIDNYTEWSNNTLDEGIVIENGAILKITGTVLMKKFIIIKPQGKLLIEGGTISSGYQDGSPWHGIYVYGDAFSVQNLNSGLFLDNATIEKASIAIRVYGAHICSPYSEENGGMGSSYDLTEYNGGYVSAINSDISDNAIGVHFKEYNFPNLSHFDNCDFFANDRSIVMDEVYDVLVEECNIGSSYILYNVETDIPSAEIVIRNAYAHIYNNVFTYGHVSLKDNAIYISGTHPMIHRWPDLVMEISGNDFNWLDNCIEVSGEVSTALVKIENNTFLDNNEGQNIIYYNGASVLNTFNNTILSGSKGIHLNNAGSYKIADLSCNTYDNIYGIGVHAEGANQLLQIKSNDLNSDIGLYVNGEVQPEEVNIPNQLWDGRPAMNCFQNDNGIDIKAENNTHFVYYYPNGVDPSSCLKPEEGPGFSVWGSQIPTNGLDCNDPPPNPQDTISDERVDLKNDTLCILKDSMDNHPGDIDPKLKYRRFLFEYHYVVDPYISRKLNEGDFARVEEVLKDACDKESKQKLFGFYMSFKDYTKAQEVLDGMDRGDIREKAFSDIEQIWLDWEKRDTKIPLTDTQIETLTEVATMNIPERGFARGILMSTMNIRVWDFDDPIEQRQAGINKESEILQNFDIFPNPANNHITINLNKSGLSGKILVIDLSGKTVLSKSFKSIKSKFINMDISGLNTGTYKLIFIDKYGNIAGKSSFVANKD